MNGEDLNINLSEQTLSNKGKPMETSTLNQTLDNNSVKPLATKEDRSDCIPRFDKTDDGVVFGGHCTVPIAGLMTIEVRGTIGVVHDAIDCSFSSNRDWRWDTMRSISMMRLTVRSVLSRQVVYANLCARISLSLWSSWSITLRQDSRPKSASILVRWEKSFPRSSAWTAASLRLMPISCKHTAATCFFLSALLHSFYQRLLHLNFNAGMTNWRLVSELKQKLEDGPKCSCQLETFRCIDSCMMKKDDVVGVIGIEWDFFFGKGSYKREFYKPRDCYSKHIHRVPECPTKSPSPSAVVR